MQSELARKPIDFCRRLVHASLAMVFPQACPHCDRLIDESGVDPRLCDLCQRKVFVSAQRSCPKCGSYGIRLVASQDRCLECKDARLAVDRVYSLGRYEGDLKAAVVQMKYEAGQPLAAAAGSLLADHLVREGCAECPDLVSCVPKFWLKRLATGVNSTEVIMSALGKRAKWPVAADLLNCQRKIAKQALLSPDQRRRNVKGAWNVARRYDITGARILLVDDTMTTGATANAVAKCLKKAGAKEVSLAVIARANRVQ